MTNFWRVPDGRDAGLRLEERRLLRRRADCQFRPMARSDRDKLRSKQTRTMELDETPCRAGALTAGSNQTVWFERFLPDATVIVISPRLRDCVIPGVAVTIPNHPL